MTNDMEALIDEAMLVHRHRLRQRWRRLRSRKELDERQHARLLEDLEKSRQWRLERASRVPEVTFDGTLPIHERLTELREAIEQHPVVIVCGETGSGKSTQLPKLCLAMGRGIDGFIGHTQPRRIAARSIAQRLADELSSTVGDAVGFKVRFTDVTRPQTYIKLMTDGILLAETQNDRFLEQYDTIIVDEAHERSLNIDFLLGYLRRLLPKRPDLRVIVTSATIDVARFSEFFSIDGKAAPVIEVSGRTYPVEIRYRPPQEEDDRELDWSDAIVAGIEECLAEGPGDVLVFLPTERDIRDLSKILRGALKQRGAIEILPLYARLPAAEQQRIFEKSSKRRIVLATNVAESSLTVPNIHYVVDTGLARVSRYSPRSKVQRLPIEAISRASADQRSGRCGRIAPGVCIRLYSEEDYASRDAYATPEVRRTNLASVILQTLSLRLGSVEQFPFLDPPAPDKIRDGYATLFELGAIDHHRELTDLGRKLARLPVDPRIARMILAAQEENCLAEVLIIAAALEAQDPRERPPEHQQAADDAHARYADERSDFFGYLKLWDFYHHLREELSRSQLQKACRQNFLSLVRLREWSEIYRQLLQLVEPLGARPTTRRDDYDAVHRALLTGLLSGVAYRGDGYEYTGAGGGKFVLWPGSYLASSRPPWVMAAEMVETSRRYLRTAARIDPDWIEPLAEHLVKRSYSDPHWSSKRGEAMIYERVTLFGMPVVARRRTRLAPIDSEAARELFLRHALVEGDAPLRANFLKHNREVRAEAQQLAAKTRRRDILPDDESIYRFYRERIPEHVTDVATLERWRREAERENPRLLYMSVEDFIDPDELRGVDSSQFPEQLQLDRTALPLEYRFEPGEPLDGITITVPRDGLATLQQSELDWLVPGLLEEKVLALIRSLPKQVRRNFVPAPDAARRITARLQFGSGPLLPALAAALSADARERITPDMFRVETLPPHLRMNVRVVDEQGHVIAAGRDVNQLRTELGIASSPSLGASGDERWNRKGLKRWDWSELPVEVELSRGAMRVPAYPAIVDEGNSVALDLYTSRAAAEYVTRYGLRRLAMLEAHRSIAEQVHWLPHLDKIQLYGGKLATPGKSLRDDLGLVICERAFCDDAEIPRSEEEYRRWYKRGKGRIALAAQDVAGVALPLFENYHHVRLKLERAPSVWRAAVDDVRAQLDALVPPGFLTRTPWIWLQHFPRYLQAIRIRLDKLSGNLARDRQLQEQVHEFWQRWREVVETDPARAEHDSQLINFRWMIEELRVSLFAQQLGVSQPVSTKRLEKLWDSVKDHALASGR